MGIFFTESRAFPRELRHLNGVGAFGQNMNTETAIADIFRSLTQGAVDFFGGSSSASKQAAAEAAAAQAAAMQAQVYGQVEEQKTLRTLMWVGGGIAAVVLVVAIAGRSSTRVKVSGYRRRKRSRR